MMVETRNCTTNADKIKTKLREAGFAENGLYMFWPVPFTKVEVFDFGTKVACNISNRFGDICHILLWKKGDIDRMEGILGSVVPSKIVRTKILDSIRMGEESKAQMKRIEDAVFSLRLRNSLDVKGSTLVISEDFLDNYPPKKKTVSINIEIRDGNLVGKIYHLETMGCQYFREAIIVSDDRKSGISHDEEVNRLADSLHSLLFK